MDLQSLPEFDNHEAVHVILDDATGLRAVIAIHSTVLGPATGGTRWVAYADDIAALKDALRLSRAMTYKCALAGVPYGGGKGVIIADPSDKRTEALEAYAKRLNVLQGSFSTGEDMGLTVEDIQIMGRISPHVNGLRGAGDLAPWAARGVFVSAQAALVEIFGDPDIREKTFAIKGLGKVGWELARLVQGAGGNIIGAEINHDVVRHAHEEFPGIVFVPPEKIAAVEAHVYSPCAFGNEFTAETVQNVRAPIVCGAANNQLAEDGVGRRFAERGTLYIPDFVANAGGLIDVVAERNPGGYDKSWVESRVAGIGDTVRDIIREAFSSRLSTHDVARAMAESILRMPSLARKDNYAENYR